MLSRRKKLLKKVRKKSYNVYGKCREDKHLWSRSKWQNNLYTCKCCSAIKFVK